MQAKERWYGPGEMAKKLGVSVKALRVYEREGLVAPLRAESGWRAYGPAQVEQLHRIIALRDLGLTLKQIKQLLDGGQAGFDAVLAMQQDALEAQRAKIGRGLNLLKAARRKLSNGEALTVDDLTHLTQETTMSKPAAMEALRTKYEALLQARDLAGERSALISHAEQHIAAIGKTRADIKAAYEPLWAEAKRLMEIGDDASEDAKALYRHWLAAVPGFKLPTEMPMETAKALRETFLEAMADPKIAGNLPFDPAIFPFVARVGKGMRERGELE
jgi:DNA-binding transcriptional MerR regulator